MTLYAHEMIDPCNNLIHNNSLLVVDGSPFKVSGVNYDEVIKMQLNLVV